MPLTLTLTLTRRIPALCVAPPRRARLPSRPTALGPVGRVCRRGCVRCAAPGWMMSSGIVVGRGWPCRMLGGYRYAYHFIVIFFSVKTEIST